MDIENVKKGLVTEHDKKEEEKVINFEIIDEEPDTDHDNKAKEKDTEVKNTAEVIDTEHKNMVKVLKTNIVSQEPNVFFMEVKL